MTARQRVIIAMTSRQRRVTIAMADHVSFVVPTTELVAFFTTLSRISRRAEARIPT